MIHKIGAPTTSLPSPWALSQTLWQVYSNRLWRASNNIQTVASSLTTHQDINEARYWEEQNTFLPYWQLPNLPGKHKISCNSLRNKFHVLWESKNFFSWDCFTNLKIRSDKFPRATPLSSHPPSKCPIPRSPLFSLLKRASSSAAFSCPADVQTRQVKQVWNWPPLARNLYLVEKPCYQSECIFHFRIGLRGSGWVW